MAYGVGPSTVKLRSRFPMIITEMNVRMAANTRVAAERVAAAARSRAPVAPAYGVEAGHLKASIHVEDRRMLPSATSAPGDAKWAVIADAKSYKGVPYAHFVEFGTRHAAPHPFLIPAYESVKETATAAIAASLRSL